jgi:hypothetical protein
VRSPQIFISETSQVPKKTDVSGSEFSDKIGPAGQDVFCEKRYFSVEHIAGFLKARGLGVVF